MNTPILLCLLSAAPTALQDGPIGLSGHGTETAGPRLDRVVDEPKDRFSSGKSSGSLMAWLETSPFKFYGYIKADGSYDSADVDTGEFARWVEPNSDGDGQANITARQTRLGVKFAGPEGSNIKSSARFEVTSIRGQLRTARTHACVTHM